MPRRPPAAVALLATLALGLTACGTHAAGGNGPSWVPKPSFAGEGIQPAPPAAVPVPGGGGNASSSSPAGKGPDPAVVATGLTAPTAVAVLPDNTALVGERTTGRIVRVQPKAGRPVRTVRTIHGLSTIGGGGLLDLALSPNYTQDNLVFAYITTRTDNRVVAFTLHGPITPVLVGIPRGPRDNTGRIAFGADGDLYVGTGDAGRPRLAADPRSLAGKVLRVTDIGRPAPGNPNPRSRVYASGMRTVNGLCVAPSTDDVFETAAAAGPGSAPINVIEPAASYGWPRPSARYLAPLAHLPAADASPGGCAVRNGVLFVTSLAGQALLAAPISLHNGQLRLGAFGASVHRYGRLRTVVAAADALWLTTSNRDGHGTPVPADERVLRIIPSSGGGGSSPV